MKFIAAFAALLLLVPASVPAQTFTVPSCATRVTIEAPTLHLHQKPLPELGEGI